MSKKVSVIIIAAGNSTRMNSDIPKHLHKIGGLEIIHHIIGTAEKLEAEEIIVVCNEKNVDYIYSNNIKKVIQTNKNGTATATKVGFQELVNKDNDILVMYGDIPLIKQETYCKMLEKLQEKDVVQVSSVFETKNISNKYGRVQIDADRIIQNIEYKDATEEEKQNRLCNGAVLAIKGNVLKEYLERIDNNNASKEYYLTDTIKLSKLDNTISKYVIVDENEIQGINSREDLAIAENIFQDMKRKEFMTKGVTLKDPNTVYFSYDTEIEQDVIIEPNVVFLNSVKVMSNVLIRSFCYLEGDILIEENSIVGPFAKIRPNTTIKNSAKIGSFVEIKNSTIGEVAKIPHLSYVGDTVIGKKTNIGAGCITCNYDGFKKHNTTIGENCFIGSNTVFIAPVCIENNSLVAAGSVITKNVTENSIAIARVEQKNIKDGHKRYKKKKTDL
ncbi:MAG: bifunctional UDP-N-acetylglucosamine diphosphorylase/glucosamine-1-phosphate N-acetyltransferase GlmU [Rickettsiales bacterium]|jgi:bifunctional UDP-N-acetylglucosamine pyrophosphorylase/glucosamine-1-phosphate N-acetyltransferase|nr:bifunctional UDP-N-acetylglucosamine diphosphorylase/glucosamine-1-phosphate N-acetyltransferase GlmU [Rickettsiales bacterium]